MHGNSIAILTGVIVLGIACQWLAWRAKLPSILFLLLSGIVIGPVLGLLEPVELFGDLLFPFVSLAVAIVLFEGSLTLRLSDIRGHGAIVRNLVTVGTVITWAVSTGASRWIIGFDWHLAALFGAIVVVSGPTVIAPLLRTVRPTESVANVLRWEGILIDPIGAILAVLVFDFIISVQSGGGFAHVMSGFIITVAIGAGLGVVLGYSLGVALRGHWFPDYLQDYATLAAAILAFGVAEMVQSESGLLAVTIMGVWLANMRTVELEDILNFKESLSLVLISGLFIILAARLDLGQVQALGIGGVAVLVVMQFVGGPLRAFVCSAGSQMGWREKALLAWIFPRGIVAGAVSSLFALRLEAQGFRGAESLVPLVFLVIIGTVLVQSLTARPLANWLEVAEPEPRGVLIVGANSVARVIARALRDAGLRVLVASSNWSHIQQARMEDIPTFYGNAMSAYADRHLDLIGLGHLLALSSRPDLNELACVRYKNEFGRDSVYTLRGRSETAGHEKHQISGEVSGRVLFGRDIDFRDLAGLVKQGAGIRLTRLTESFSFSDYLTQNPSVMIMFALDSNGNLRFPVADAGFEPSAGWRVAGLLPGSVEQAREDR